MVTAFGPPGILVNELGPFPGHFDQRRDLLDTRSFSQPTKPDEKWSHTDSSNHFHSYNLNNNASIFTAEEKFVTRVTYSNYYDNADGDEEWRESIGWYCILCGEKIPTPARVPDMNPAPQWGLRSWSVEFENVPDGRVWGLLQSGRPVSIRIPSINGFGIGSPGITGISNEGYSFIVHGEGEFGRHG